MTKIYVVPHSLLASSKDMLGTGANVDSAGDRLLAAAKGAPSYEGQFGPWIQGLAAEARGRSKLYSTEVSGLGFRVRRKGEQFAAVDQGSVLGASRIPYGVGPFRQGTLLWWLATIHYGKFFEALRRLYPWLFIPRFLIPAIAIRLPWFRPPSQAPVRPEPLPEPAPPTPPASEPVKIDKPIPVALASTALPTADGSCAIYAQKRRPDLGPVGTAGNGNYGAGNYIHKYEDRVFQTLPNDNLQEKIATGYALIWEIGHPKANATYGHVAIVEEVHPDYVIISHAGFGKDGASPMKLSRELVSTLYVLP